MRAFRRNPFFQRELVRQREYKDARIEAAQEIADAAASIAPVDEGEYRDSFYVAEDGDMIAAASSDIASVVNEFGGTNHPTFATLRRAVGVAGFGFGDKGGQ